MKIDDENGSPSHSMEVPPVPATDSPTVLLNLEGPEHYRGCQMTSLYFPPIT